MKTKKFPIKFVMWVPSRKLLKTPHNPLTLVGTLESKRRSLDIHNFYVLQMHFQSRDCKLLDKKGIGMVIELNLNTSQVESETPGGWADLPKVV